MTRAIANSTANGEATVRLLPPLTLDEMRVSGAAKALTLDHHQQPAERIQVAVPLITRKESTSYV